MPTRNSANRLPAGYGLGDDPRPLLGAPCPPPTSPREELDAPGILSVSTMLSDHSKPNGETDTEDSQNSWPRERWGPNSAYNELTVDKHLSRRRRLRCREFMALHQGL
jgi:hypothetical protein